MSIQTYIDDFDVVVVTEPEFITLALANDHGHFVRKLLDIKTILADNATRHILQVWDYISKQEGNAIYVQSVGHEENQGRAWVLKNSFCPIQLVVSKGKKFDSPIFLLCYS